MNIEYTIYTIYKQTILESNLHFNLSTNNKILTVEIYTMIRLLVPTNILPPKSQHTESTFFVKWPATNHKNRYWNTRFDTLASSCNLLISHHLLSWDFSPGQTSTQNKLFIIVIVTDSKHVLQHRMPNNCKIAVSQL